MLKSGMISYEHILIGGIMTTHELARLLLDGADVAICSEKGKPISGVEEYNNARWEDRSKRYIFGIPEQLISMKQVEFFKGLRIVHLVRLMEGE
jgi:hypothetical protein